MMDDLDAMFADPVPRKRRPGRPAAKQPEDLALKEARTRAANATAALAEMKREISSGALVRREDVAATWAAILTDLRAALLGIPSRIDCDPATRAAVDREIHDTLTRIAGNA